MLVVTRECSDCGTSPIFWSKFQTILYLYIKNMTTINYATKAFGLAQSASKFVSNTFETQHQIEKGARTFIQNVQNRTARFCLNPRIERITFCMKITSALALVTVDGTGIPVLMEIISTCPEQSYLFLKEVAIPILMSDATCDTEECIAFKNKLDAVIQNTLNFKIEDIEQLNIDSFMKKVKKSKEATKDTKMK